MVAIALLASAGIQFCVIQKSLYTELAEAKRAADEKRVDERRVDEKRAASDGAAGDAAEVDAKTK